MRKNRRMKNENKKNLQDKIIMYSIIGVAALAIILTGLLMYSKSLSDNVKDGALNLEEIAKNNEQNNENTNSTSVSTEIGKSVNEVKNEVKSETNNVNTNASTNNTVKNNNTNTNNTAKKEEKLENTNKISENKEKNITDGKQEVKTSAKQELNFSKPVEGDVIKEFAKDNLLYSNTLQEWTTHMGIDIKADKTTVVKSAEAGTVKSIKNDPRYGLTIVIEHENGYQTVYSNLLSTEFVVEGEKVEKGQSIGTVGNSASFEVADEPHLHFEVLKDSTEVDPNIYLK